MTARNARRLVLVLLAAGVTATACSTVPAKLPAAADQSWGTLATASADPGATAGPSSENQPALPPNPAPPLVPLPAPGSYPPNGSLAKIFERGFLRVAVSRDTQRFGAWNPVARRYEGFDVEIARAVARALFGVADPDRAGVLTYLPVSYSERLPTIERRRADIVVSTLTYTPARAKRIGLSQAYFTAHPRLLTRRDPARAPGTPRPDTVAGAFAELAGKRVCAPPATTSLVNLQRKHAEFGGFEIEGHLNELSDCLVAFQQGTVDAVAANDASLVGMLEQDATAELGSVNIGQDEYYSVGFGHDDAELGGFVNGVLEGMLRGGTGWQKLCEDWIVPPVMTCAGSRPPEPSWAR